MAKKKSGADRKKDGQVTGPTRKRILQADVPRHPLREALTIPQAITDNFAGHATPPHQVAMALKISPTSSAWRTLNGAAAAYGLTTGAYNSDTIALEDLGRRATAPKEEGDDLKARAEAALKPRVFTQFVEKYQRAKFPPDNIARNVIEQNFGVPRERADEVLTTLKDNGAFVGFIHQTKTGPFVATDQLSPSPVTIGPTPEAAAEHQDVGRELQAEATRPDAVAPPAHHAPSTASSFKVFISHGKDMGIVEQVKDVLDLYDIDYEVAVEEETTAIPVVVSHDNSLKFSHAFSTYLIPRFSN